MKATETQLVKFLQGTRQFIIPIYQRTYSWTEKQCEQLWNDIIRVAQNPNIPGHFIGSIVYIEKGLYQVSDVPQLLVIDGQQRLTTLSLLLMAFGKALEEKGDGQEITKNKINNYFLFNSEESGEKRYKLILTQSDKDTLFNILEDREKPERYSLNIENNFKFFQNQISKSNIDLDVLYQGILKLVIVDISLDSNYDNPQLIFESLNSTGLELSQADLIRNYVLMGLEREKQEQVYKNFWHPMEESFGHSEGSEYFDRFMRDYLTIKTGQIPNIREVYSSFKEYTSATIPVDELVSDIHHFSKFFIKLAFEKEQDPELNQIIRNINALKVEVAYPFLLEVLVNFDKGLISRDELLEIFLMVESYVFRRAICDIPTNSLNKTFANLASEIDKDAYLESIKAAFNLKESYRRFPNDSEFRAQLIIKNVYNTTRIRKYLLDKLENYERKEPVNVENYTLEHIMPQNKNLSPEWRNELGENWSDIHEKYLHTVGNLTLTGYNSELSDNPFLEKRNMEGGFADSPIRLNADLAILEHWNEDEIVKRANSITDKAIEIWKYPELPQETLAKYTELEDDDDEDLDEDEIKKPQWDDRVALASNEVKENLNELISKINEKFECESEPYWKWLFFYVTKPTERKNCFALLTCGKSTANVIFRINPESFKGDEHVRKVVGWFFPRETERRMSIKKEFIPQIIHYLEHAYSTTNALRKKRHEAAIKAWSTMRKRDSET